jgi:hypothetical protein
VVEDMGGRQNHLFAGDGMWLAVFRTAQIGCAPSSPKDSGSG